RSTMNWDADEYIRRNLSEDEQREAEAIKARDAQDRAKKPNDLARGQRDQRQPEYVPAYKKGLVTLTGAELLRKEFPPPEMILSPWLPEKGLAMIFAERGIGKTWIGLNIAHAVAGGGLFLGWRVPRPRRVVYLDGEMPAAALKERYAVIIANSE